MDKYSELRAALEAVPCVKWTASRSTVHIPETEDWAGKDLCITGLDKKVARKLARYIADAGPEAIRALLVERDALLDALTDLTSANDHVEYGRALAQSRAALAQGES